MKVLLALVLLLVFVENSECVQCFAQFDMTTGECSDEIGEVEEDDCCQNTKYGYQATDGSCQSCGPLVWTPWSSWSPCNVLCGEGVRQRNKKCFGIGQSECDRDDTQIEPCIGTCCDAEGWGVWGSWSSCSITCGEGGVRKRARVCSSPPECQLACSGPSEETEACPTQTCPVHGGWSAWSDWSQCSGSCIDQHGNMPTKYRHRSCSNPTPSKDTVPPGNGCDGDSTQVEDCLELPNCPVDGSWGAWSPPGPCSVSCGEGLQLSIRTCNNPAQKYGGRFCDGPSTRSSICQSPCPVDGFWSGWSNWGECSSSCIQQGQVPTRTRHHSCSNPAPSSSPPGRSCQGVDREVEKCNHLPHCQVDGGWGPWSPFTSCPVTCGVGLQVSNRKCDSPAPQHGGQPCHGERLQTNICTTNIYCPVDGVWSEWSPWGQCEYPFGNRIIRCKQLGGMQNRERECLHRAHNGSICSGGLTERRVCYDVDTCYMKGVWDGWGTWTLCRPVCGTNSKRVRARYCKPDFSQYSPTIGRQNEKATFFGNPTVDCGATPGGGPKYERQPCLNLPACPE